MPMMTPDEAAAMVQEKIKIAEQAVDKYAVSKFREDVLKDINLPTEAVRALLAGYEKARSDIKAILVLSHMGGLGNTFCSFCSMCGRCADCIIDSNWRGPSGQKE